jgi:pimeloyl-ACP methyl ester carboxylesterase
VSQTWRGNGRVALAGLCFNPGAPRRALALHGWLDNAMSFSGLADALPEWEILALDFAGHGESGHLPGGNWYHFIDYLDDVAAALEDRPVDLLIGHSLGGAVATAWAAARPDSVARLVLIEALGPLAGDPDGAVRALRQGLDERRGIRAKQLRRFTGREQAVAARLGANRMERSSAEALITRGLRPDGDGWCWASDPRLTVTTPWRLPEAVIQQWIAAVEAPTLLLAADHAPPYFQPEARAARLALLRNGQLRVIAGHHHLHLDSPTPVALAIREFVGTVSPPAAD